MQNGGPGMRSGAAQLGVVKAATAMAACAQLAGKQAHPLPPLADALLALPLPPLQLQEESMGWFKNCWASCLTAEQSQLI